MLRFAAKRLVRERWEEPQDAWVYLEDFLVHYRNLIEFLGKQDNIRDTDRLVDAMSEKIEPLLTKIVPVLQSQSHNVELLRSELVEFLGPHAASTAVCTPTVGAVDWLKRNERNLASS